MKRSAVGATLGGLVALLIAGPFLGSAAGHIALHLWSKHPRTTAKLRPDSPHNGWKTPPGTTAPAAPVVVAPSIGLAPAPMPIVVASAHSRPPFVPPRS